MRKKIKNWIWFVGLLALILGLGIFLGRSRRAEPGENLLYSLDEFRHVDPALVRYREVEGLQPSLTNLTALAVGRDGRVFVGGTGGVEVLPGGERIETAEAPSCLAVDGAGRLFVGLRDRIVSDGMEWRMPGEKPFVTSVAVDDWYFYVADAGGRMVWRFNKKDQAEPLPIGKKEPLSGVRGFVVPSPYFDVAIASNGSLWVVNPGRHSLENYRPEGAPLARWDRPSMGIDGFCGCCNPSHMALLSDGSIVTAEKGLPRVKIHAEDGSLVCVVATPDQFAPEVSGLDVAVDAQDRIYVLDPMQGRVRIFEEKL